MEFLSVFQKTTLALAIVFSILTLAIVFYTLMHTTKFKSPFMKVLFTIITPMVTFIMWFACMFAGLGVLNSNELYIFLISIVCGAGLMGLAYGIAYLIYYLIKRKNADYDEANDEKENQVNETVIEDELTAEQPNETNEENTNDEIKTDEEQVFEDNKLMGEEKNQAVVDEQDENKNEEAN